ncbi:LysE family transporter [Clostridium sp. PL3]|uniref:LysE family transporter n=1 Tax=Clostridium thailandense TaxID=2794346 RepID=A0A949TY89_9CLOT|nr:LysE family transporter [Clostridium thailandense]MBV7273790.1 LysE family transporter [Clostridium thailandense]
MIFKGFKFGMLLQLAIGPVCIFIFQIAVLKGFYAGEIATLGATLVDGIFITIATLGIASIINRRNIRICLKIFGSVILFVFGISMILSQFNIDFLPSLCMFNIPNSNDIFIRIVILTASNPLTIVFWAGIFSAKVAEENMEKKDIYFFGFGALLSTMIFLTLISLIGSFANVFFPTQVIQFLNIIVGLLLIYFALRMLLKNT